MMRNVKKSSCRLPDAPSDIIAAHKFSSCHREKLLNDSLCGCFYCMKIFNPNEIEMWVEDPLGTAVCPCCGIDSVIGEYSGYPITNEFLTEMNKYWFGIDIKTNNQKKR